MGGSAKIFLHVLARWAAPLAMERVPSPTLLPLSYSHPTFTSHMDFFSDCPRSYHSPGSGVSPFVNSHSVGRHGLTFGTTASPFPPIDFAQLRYIRRFIALYFLILPHNTFSCCFQLQKYIVNLHVGFHKMSCYVLGLANPATGSALHRLRFEASVYAMRPNSSKTSLTPDD